MLINATLTVNNLPELSGRSGYMVITNDRGELWFYELYGDYDRALEAVNETDTRFMVKL